MVGPDVVYRYFPDLSERQKQQIEQLYPLYAEWNAKINVVSRKDIEELYLRHVLHALSLLKVADFSLVHSVLDIGTGGGFPGIPLAILLPDTDFHLVDSIAKKIQVVSAVAEDLGLKNVKAECARAEQIQGKYDVVCCRAVTRLSGFYGWIKKNLRADSEVLCLKGGDLSEEIAEFKAMYPGKRVKTYAISTVFEDSFFETKKILQITAK